MTVAMTNASEATTLMVRPRPQFQVVQNGERSSQTAIEPNGSSIGDAIDFGPFRLLPTQRLLLKDDKPVPLGSRAMDILIALVERPTELVSKEELMARVWPNTFVEPANLTVHISALRRALRDGRDGNRFFVNIPGRGYRFVSPVSVDIASEPTHPIVINDRPIGNLPASVTTLFGRHDFIATLTTHLRRNRLVTVVGMGGVGKTSVATAAAQQLIHDYRDGVWFVDFGAVTDAAQVPDLVATVLGFAVRPGEPHEFSAQLKCKRMLLVFDNCAHLAGSVATLTTELLRGAREVNILATSRVPLRAEGERVCRLGGLDLPEEGKHINVDEALSYPAVQMFVDRVSAELDDFTLTDEDIAPVLEICRALDGIPLALEFAAARVPAFGLQQLAECLSKSLQSLTNYRLTAAPRHQSLYATFEWSFRLLSEPEQILFRRLSVFENEFTLREALAAVGHGTLDWTTASDLVASLVAKSLVVPIAGAGLEPRFRLPATIRAYARAKLAESNEVEVGNGHRLTGRNHSKKAL
jgi:predicted ATPase/DNA-binding winged helix-turn-helix (wHTH) protein